MSSPFDPPDQFIRQGPDGHHFYVRRKSESQLPSFKSIFAEAFHDLWHGSPPYWREWKKENKQHKRAAKAAAKAVQAAAAATPLLHPRSSPSAASLPAIPILPQNPVIMSNAQPPTDPGNGQNGNVRGILKPDLQRFPSNAYGLPPNNGMPFNQPQVPQTSMQVPQHHPYAQQFGGYPPQMGYSAPHLHNPMHSQLSLANIPPGPTQPMGGWQGVPLPPGARALSPPRYPTADDLKYKCAICNRFRSLSYHYKHPLPQGQLPPKTICRKCKEAATDSEDESTNSEISLREPPRQRRRSRSGSRIGSTTLYEDGLERGRRRTQSRAASRDQDYYYDEGRPRRRSFSRSGSVEYLPRARSRSALGHERSLSPSNELVIVRQRPQRPRRVVYVDELDDDGCGSKEYIEYRT